MPRLPQYPQAVSEFELIDLSHIGSIKNILGRLPAQKGERFLCKLDSEFMKSWTLYIITQID